MYAKDYPLLRNLEENLMTLLLFMTFDMDRPKIEDPFNKFFSRDST
jgi:hypothetical protein